MTIATLFFAGFIGNQAVEAVSDDLFIKAVKWAFISFTLLNMTGIYFSFNRGKIQRRIK
jgi:hypothetical protein